MPAGGRHPLRSTLRRNASSLQPRACRTQRATLLDLNQKTLAAFELPAADRSALIGSSSADFASLTTSLAAYEERSADLPGEHEWRAQFDGLLSGQNSVALKLLAPDVVDAAQVTQHATTALSLSMVLQKISTLYTTRIVAETHAAVCARSVPDCSRV